MTYHYFRNLTTNRATENELNPYVVGGSQAILAKRTNSMKSLSLTRALAWSRWSDVSLWKQCIDAQSPEERPVLYGLFKPRKQRGFMLNCEQVPAAICNYAIVELSDRTPTGGGGSGSKGTSF